jgi:hypothetical protein
MIIRGSEKRGGESAASEGARRLLPPSFTDDSVAELPGPGLKPTSRGDQDVPDASRRQLIAVGRQTSPDQPVRLRLFELR